MPLPAARVLAPELLKEVEFVAADGRSGMLSLARSLLVRRRTPVAFLMNSHSLDPTVIQERRDLTEELLQLAAASVPAKVIVAVPELEASFFAVPKVIQRVLGEEVPADLASLGPRDPHGVLQELSRRSNRPWDPNRAIQLLEADDIERIRDVPAVKELSRFLQGVQWDGEAA